MGGGQHLAAAHVPHLVGGEPADAGELRGRDGEGVGGRFHEQRADEGHGERHGEREGGPGAGHGLEADRPVEGAHLALDDVEADATPGDGGQGPGGGEAGVEDQREQVAVVDRFRQPLRARRLADAVAVEAVAVVGDRDLDLRALQGRGDRDRARRRLPRRHPGRGQPDAVVDRVPDQVQERVLEPFRHRAVDLDLLADQLERDFLARGEGEVAHGPLQPLRRLAEGDHAQAAHRRVELARGAHQPAPRLPVRGHDALQPVDHLADAGRDLLHGGAERAAVRPGASACRRRKSASSADAASSSVAHSARRLSVWRTARSSSPLRDSTLSSLPALTRKVSPSRRSTSRRCRGGRERSPRRTGVGVREDGAPVLLPEPVARLLDRVRGRVEELEGVGVERTLAVAGAREDVLQRMAGGLHDADVHGARGALQVVRGAEEGLQEGGGVAVCRSRGRGGRR